MGHPGQKGGKKCQVKEELCSSCTHLRPSCHKQAVHAGRESLDE
jgi:hypothetical protein